MGTFTAHEDSRLNLWLHVRRYAVPPLMIEAATARRRVGDWAGACAVAGFDIDFTPRSVARTHGWALAHQVRADLRQLAPDLLRWHMPRIAPDGLLRPGVTVPLARYDTGDGPPLHLVAKTPPLRAAAGQRIGLALWDGRRELTRTRAQAEAATRAHPHPLPSRRFRLDLHRHLWDAARAHELRGRTGGAGAPGSLGPAVHRWAAEAQLLRRAEGTTGPVAVRLGPGRRTALDHGDARGALAAVESLLGPAALLRDELTAAAAARTHHALYRANLPRPAPPPPPRSPRWAPPVGGPTPSHPCERVGGSGSPRGACAPSRALRPCVAPAPAARSSATSPAVRARPRRTTRNGNLGPLLSGPARSPSAEGAVPGAWVGRGRSGGYLLGLHTMTCVRVRHPLVVRSPAGAPPGSPPPARPSAAFRWWGRGWVG